MVFVLLERLVHRSLCVLSAVGVKLPAAPALFQHDSCASSSGIRSMLLSEPSPQGSPWPCHKERQRRRSAEAVGHKGFGPSAFRSPVTHDVPRGRSNDSIFRQKLPRSPVVLR